MANMRTPHPLRIARRLWNLWLTVAFLTLMVEVIYGLWAGLTFRAMTLIVVAGGAAFIALALMIWISTPKPRPVYPITPPKHPTSGSTAQTEHDTVGEGDTGDGSDDNGPRDHEDTVRLSP